MKPMVILTGPTAVGKTALSIRLAKAIGGEIISADSMQVYQKMNIGTAKIKTDEMEGIPHYLVDVLDPAEEFHVARFQKMAKEALQNIYGKGKIPLVVGGTGFYIQSLLYDIDFEEEEQDMEYREMLWKMSREEGNEALHRMLSQKDPVSAQKIHPNNVKRVIRALEFYRLNGYPISEHNEKESQKESPYQFAYFVLNQDRKKLYERIDQRVDLMMEAGLLKEVQELKEEGYGKSLVSMQGIGYKEIYEYLEGNLTLDQAVDLIKKDTRHFAKRQLTWFGREKDVIMIQKEQFETEEEILQHMLEILKQKGIYHG
ncbi:MAG TPA: tRNA (adenosine(37)-N6)-dimethylallyltransferase MiaA [Candidatus Anaerostipes excrementavium]|uniref:tRNA dimethylallyltransferase n=1 Tax=Candidatus Anaerostipes excrementavium TaxID=2838463 RepID=A0A9D1WYM7_9FIRM|nr:tRNA (adenosine(37)-N6)-dimethylallyltransferase MiaA [uncultured Anaerostipes sp.]HIX68405.1 tRNA (adenosine(37)-N6)-dimethylallyltransferase MiaA [Candidatus Anaerostipes excrementavium]